MRPTWPLSAMAAGPLVVALAVPACSLAGLADGGPRVDGGSLVDGGTAADGALLAGDATTAGPGCPGCVTLVANEENPTELAILDGALHWIRDASRGAVVRSDLDGKDLEVERNFPIANGHDLAGAFDGNTFESVYAVGRDGTMHRYHSYSTCSMAEGTLRVVSFGDDLLFAKTNALARGGCGDVTTLLAGTFLGIAADTPYAWFTRDNGEIGRCDATTATSCASSAGVMARDQGPVRTLARDGTRLFWVHAAAPVEIRSRLKADPAVTAAIAVVATGLGEPRSLVPAGNDLYWTDAARGTVERAPVGGGAPPVVVASGLARPWGLVVTAATIYFTESGAGRIVRMPR